MNKIALRLSNAPFRLMAASSLATSAIALPAHAQTGAGGMATTVNGQMAAGGTLLLSSSFLAGIGLVVHGFMKLKAAADSQGREPYGPGVWRFFVGAGLIALPTFSATFRDTFTGGNTGTVGVGTATFSN